MPLQKWFGIRRGEGLPVLLLSLYLAIVVAAFLLAKPVRNGLFLEEYGAVNLVYVYASVPIALAVFVPVYTRLAARRGQRALSIATLLFFSVTLLGFWYALRFLRLPASPALFYVWVNCYGVVAPVQVWTLATSVFDPRQARRLFGLIGVGGSIGAVAGGLMATTLVETVGGAVNLILVMAGLLVVAVLVVNATRAVIPPRPVPAVSRRSRGSLVETLRVIQQTPYLRLIGALVVLVAIATQWTEFQFSLVAEQTLSRDADRLTSFFGRFNFVIGLVAIVLQLSVTRIALRRFGLSVTILVLPLALATGSTLILLAPVLGTVLLTAASDQALRFSVDKASYELLYVPLAPGIRSSVKAAIDIVISRAADLVGALALGLVTGAFMMGGVGFELRGIAAINLVFIGSWIAVALALRRAYVDAIGRLVREHRLDAERDAAVTLERSAAEQLAEKLESEHPGDILYALDLLEAEAGARYAGHPTIRVLLDHPADAVRRRALAMLRAAGDASVQPRVERLLHDPDVETRTEALLFLAEHAGVDPLARIAEISDLPDFSVRAGIVAFLGRPGASQNLDAARVLLAGMIDEAGTDGLPARVEAARVMALLPRRAFWTELQRLLKDPDPEVVRAALRTVGRLGTLQSVDEVIGRLADPELGDAAQWALEQWGDRIVDTLRGRLVSPRTAPAVRLRIPSVLVRIDTPDAKAALVDGLTQSDARLRYEVITALNKVQRSQPDVSIDRHVVETVLGAEILGHYRSHQILGTLEDARRDIVDGLRESMAQELERIFRLLGLLFPERDLKSAHFGLQSDDPVARANALEFLDNVVSPPELRHLLVPLLDSHVSLRERMQLASQLAGVSPTTHEEAVRALVTSDDPWLRSCGFYAIGALGLDALAPALDEGLHDHDPLAREAARAARREWIDATADQEAVESYGAETEPADAMGLG